MSDSNVLLQPLDEPSHALIEVVIEQLSSDQRWPIADFVRRSLHAKGIDLDSVLRGTPAIGHARYGPIWTEAGVGAVQPTHLIGATIAGLAHVRSAAGLVQNVLRVVRELASAYNALPLDPQMPSELSVCWADIVQFLVQERGDPDPAEVTKVLAVLAHEPPGWGCLALGRQPSEARWKVSSLVGRFDEVAATDDYLDRVYKVLVPEATLPLRRPQLGLVHDEIAGLRQRLVAELGALDSKKEEILRRMDLGNPIGAPSGEEAAVVEGTAHADNRGRVEEAIRQVLINGSRTRPSGLTGNAESLLQIIDDAAAEASDGWLSRAQIEEAAGFGDPYLGKALRDLHGDGLIDGATAEELEGPVVCIALRPAGRRRLADVVGQQDPLSAPRVSEMPYGFLLMPFSSDLAWLKAEIEAAGEQAGVRIERADDISRPGPIIDQVSEAIKGADVVVAVCTGQNVNVFFEMGLAWRDHRPILVAESPDDLPFDVRHFRTELYGRDQPGQDRGSLRQRAAQAMEATLEERRSSK